MTGYVHVYTGDGKGKTTAAFGLAVRAAGAGMKAFVAQFVKGQPTGEMDALRQWTDQVTVKQYGAPWFIMDGPAVTDIEMALRGFQEVSDVVMAGNYSLVVMDEINLAIYLGLIPIDRVLRLIDAKPKHVELVLTGRYSDPRVIERADLVTEMRAVKHYYSRGVSARRGIES